MTAAVSHGQHRDDCSCKPCATDLHDVHDLELVLEEDWVADGADVVQRVGLDRLDLQGGRDGGEQLVDGPARAGWVSVLLLEWLRNAVQPPGPTDSLSLSRVGQHPAIGTATERSVTTRLKDSLSLSRVGQHPAIGMATERSAATRPNGQPLSEPGGSASCYWNGYGTQCSHPAQQTDSQVVVHDELLQRVVGEIHVEHDRLLRTQRLDLLVRRRDLLRPCASRPPEPNVSTPNHTKHPGWCDSKKFRVASRSAWSEDAKTGQQSAGGKQQLVSRIGVSGHKRRN